MIKSIIIAIFITLGIAMCCSCSILFSNADNRYKEWATEREEQRSYVLDSINSDLKIRDNE